MNLLDFLHQGGAVAHYWTPDSGEFYTDKETGERKERKHSIWFPVGQRPALPSAWAQRNVYFCVHPQTAIPEKINNAGKKIADRYVKSRLAYVAAVNCFFGEFDAKHYGGKEAILAHLETLPLYPSVIIDSGGGFHCYWLLDKTCIITEENRTIIKEIQYAWVDLVKSDDDAKDLARVLRVPGTKNLKPAYAPDFPTVAIVCEDYSFVYPLEQFAILTKDLRKREEPAKPYTGQHTFADDVTTAALCLKSLAPHRRDEYSEWVEVGMALSSLGTTGLQLWDEWSQGGSKYKPGDCKAKWNSFSPNTGVNIGSLVNWAKMDDPNFYKPKTYTNGHAKTSVAPAPQEVEAVERRTYAQLLGEMKAQAIQTYDEQFTIDCLFNGEEGDARLLDSVLKNNMVYDHAEELWYWYNNLFWEPDRTLNIHQLTSDVLSELYKHLSVRKHAESIELEKALFAKEDAKQEERDELKKVIAVSKAAKTRSVKLNEINEVKRVLVFACSGLRLGTTGEQWDTNIELLGVQNGVVNLLTGRLVQPHAAQYIRTVAPVKFDAQARCPIWEKSLLEIFDGDAGNAAYVRRLLGYAMSGTCIESDFPLWYGKDGRNGKEFILERIRNVLGDKLAGVAESELLLKSKNDRGKNAATEGLMVLRGRRIAWASETNEGKQMDLASMKDLSGGHLLTGRHNFGHQVEWKRTHTIILLTNHKPHINSQALAEWDRIRLLEFPLSFVNEPDPEKPNQRKKDKTLGERIDATELSGILNWLIAGCLEWRSVGLAEPETVKQATERYRQDEDTLGHFIRECCFVGEDAKCKPVDLYKAYVAWVDPGAKPMGKKTFYGKIEEIPYQRGFAMGYEWFYGIGVRID